MIHRLASLLALVLPVVKIILHRRWIWNAAKRHLHRACRIRPGRQDGMTSRRTLAYERVRIDGQDYWGLPKR